MAIDAADRIVSFVEKPSDPPAMPGNPDISLASMGVYVFKTSFLIEQCRSSIRCNSQLAVRPSPRP